MTRGLYERFALTPPSHIGEAHTAAIELELGRLQRALEAGDDGQALGDLKSLIEAIAKVTLDLNGTPAGGSDGLETTVKRAHELLANQPGRELAVDSPFGNLATQARKMATSMAEIRNNYGGGHGRARQPELKAEMLDLALDGSLLWVRWALRRLGHFARGRPEALIRDLVGDPYGQITFRTGDLTARLNEANFPDLEPRHAGAIGVAVGQRAARNTFLVRDEGVTAAINDPDLTRWPSAYRLGVATGLLFSPEEIPTVTARNLHQALRVCEPVLDAGIEIVALLQRVLRTVPPGQLPGEQAENSELFWFVNRTRNNRPEAEQAAWAALERHLLGLEPLDS